MIITNSKPNNQKYVVSVRLDLPVVEALNALAERTGRSRGFYMREALKLHLPQLRERYWAQTVHHELAEEDKLFETLMQQLLDE